MSDGPIAHGVIRKESNVALHLCIARTQIPLENRLKTKYENLDLISTVTVHLWRRWH